MTVLNVLLRPDRLAVAVDTLAENASSGAPSVGAKALLVPQHNIVLAARGSARLLLHLYSVLLQASFRPDFQIERAAAEMGALIDRVWPAYEASSAQMGIAEADLGIELVLGGWSNAEHRMIATAYAKSSGAAPAIVRCLEGGLASPGEPLRGRPDSFEPQALLEAGRLQARYLNEKEGRVVAGDHLLLFDLTQGRAVVTELGML